MMNDPVPRVHNLQQTSFNVCLILPGLMNTQPNQVQLLSCVFPHRLVKTYQFAVLQPTQGNLTALM